MRGQDLMRSRRHWLCALLLATLVACSDAAIPPLVPPAGAERYLEERSFDPLIAVAETELVADLRREYSPLETQRWKVPHSLGFDRLVMHYRNQLGAAWQEDSRLAGPRNTNPRVLFTRGGKVVALAYVDPPGADIGVLLVARSAK